MANTPTVYAICGNNCKYETLTREQIYTAITQAVESGEIKDVNTGFVQTIKTINGKGLKFFVGVQSEYEALTEDEKQSLFAIITNDTTKEGILNALESLQTETTELKTSLANGLFVVKKSESLIKTEHTEVTVNDNGQLYFNFEEGKLYLVHISIPNTSAFSLVVCKPRFGVAATTQMWSSSTSMSMSVSGTPKFYTLTGLSYDCEGDHVIHNLREWYIDSGGAVVNSRVVNYSAKIDAFETVTR